MFKNVYEIEYLVGKKIPSSNPFVPYDKIICDFLASFSKELIKEKKIKNFPELKSLSFWCRKANLEILKKNNLSKFTRLGLGLLFHITPSNIPTNFIYSLIFGLLTGNSNIVKVPTKKFNEIEIICSVLNKVLKNDKFKKIKDRILIIRYKDRDDFTKEISSQCDGRIIWGGDKTIQSIRKFKIKEKTQDFTFPDRYSFCVINTKTLPKINNKVYKNLAKKFYNDTFLVDQNACSSPHLIIWYGKKDLRKQNFFWRNVFDVSKEKYDLSERAVMEKYNELCNKMIESKELKLRKNYDNLIYTIKVKKIFPGIDNLRGKWGLFYEYYMKNFKDLSLIINHKYQTLTYHGFKKEFLKKFVVHNNLKGIDRIVPIGSALDIGLIWDGYDLNKSLTRIIDIK
tara:strand:+ start:287 stop:1480 length:1194 start_codon:yes stop_codon:yes gene_type:complete